MTAKLDRALLDSIASLRRIAIHDFVRSGDSDTFVGRLVRLSSLEKQIKHQQETGFHDEAL